MYSFVFSGFIYLWYPIFSIQNLDFFFCDLFVFSRLVLRATVEVPRCTANNCENVSTNTELKLCSPSELKGLLHSAQVVSSTYIYIKFCGIFFVLLCNPILFFVDEQPNRFIWDMLWAVCSWCIWWWYSGRFHWYSDGIENGLCCSFVQILQINIINLQGIHQRIDYYIDCIS